MTNKRVKGIKLEYKKRSAFLKHELWNNVLKFVIRNSDVSAGKQILAKLNLTRKRNKMKSISYHTSFCLETGHYKSRVNWGKLSRYSFKSTANKNNFSFLTKKSN